MAEGGAVHGTGMLGKCRGGFPGTIIEGLRSPAAGWMNGGLPLCVAGEGFSLAVFVFHDERCDHGWRVGMHGTVGIADVVHSLNRNRVRTLAEISGHVGADKLLPRHLSPRRKGGRSQHLRAVDPGGDGVLAGGKQRGVADGLGQ